MARRDFDLPPWARVVRSPGSRAMSHIDGSLIPVTATNNDAYRELAIRSAAPLK